jgi:uncharacterized protein
VKLGRESSNVEDRRGMRVGPAIGGIGGVVLLIAALVLGVDPRQLLEQSPQAAALTPEDSAALANDPGRMFVSQVLADT